MTYTTHTATRTYTTDEGETRTYTVEVVTFPVTIDGETRDIEFTIIGNPNVAHSREVFGCRRGQGKKIHRTNAALCNVDGEWVFDWHSGYALNRGGCAIVAFADQVADTRKSEHVGTAI
jgi:hypothetical protein